MTNLILCRRKFWKKDYTLRRRKNRATRNESIKFVGKMTFLCGNDVGGAEVGSFFDFCDRVLLQRHGFTITVRVFIVSHVLGLIALT